MKKLKKYFRRWLWIHQLKMCWKHSWYNENEGYDYGQFLSNVGYEIACGRLPKGILDPRWGPLHKKVVITT